MCGWQHWLTGWSLFIVPNGLTHLFLIINVIAMVACSTLVIVRRYSEYAVAGLMGVVVTQALGYGLIFDLNFFLRNLSVIGGLIMVLSDSWVRKTKAFAGLPQLEEKDRKMYFQLARPRPADLPLVGFVFSGQWSIWRVLVSVLGFIACVMVVVGFKAKFSAIAPGCHPQHLQPPGQQLLDRKPEPPPRPLFHGFLREACC